MGMLSNPVRLHDVTDVEGFVNRTINRANLSLSRDEREELVLEGIALMYKLSDQYQPHRNGHARNDGRFSGYAAMFLPRKLGDAWHRMHPEHRQVADPETGKRRWAYLPKPTSYETVVAAERSDDSIGVLETRVRFHSDEFSPIPLSPRPRHDDATRPARQVARAA